MIFEGFSLLNVEKKEEKIILFQKNTHTTLGMMMPFFLNPKPKTGSSLKIQNTHTTMGVMMPSSPSPPSSLAKLWVSFGFPMKLKRWQQNKEREREREREGDYYNNWVIGITASKHQALLCPAWLCSPSTLPNPS